MKIITQQKQQCPSTDDKCPSDMVTLESKIDHLKERLKDLKYSICRTKDIIRTPMIDKDLVKSAEAFVKPECRNRIDSLSAEVDEMNSIASDIMSMNDCIFELFD